MPAQKVSTTVQGEQTLQSPDAESKRRKYAYVDKAKAVHLSRQLQLRLQYARLKVDHGWQKQNLNEVENLYFRRSHLNSHKRPDQPQLNGIPILNAPSHTQEKTEVQRTDEDVEMTDVAAETAATRPSHTGLPSPPDALSGQLAHPTIMLPDTQTNPSLSDTSLSLHGDQQPMPAPVTKRKRTSTQQQTLASSHSPSKGRPPPNTTPPSPAPQGKTLPDSNRQHRRYDYGADAQLTTLTPARTPKQARTAAAAAMTAARAERHTTASPSPLHMTPNTSPKKPGYAASPSPGLTMTYDTFWSSHAAVTGSTGRLGLAGPTGTAGGGAEPRDGMSHV